MHPMMQSLFRATVYVFRGRLASKPEVRFFDSGTCVANVSLAVDHPDKKRDDKDKTDWFKLELWGAEAQEFADSVDKGQMIDVEGRVRLDGYTNRQGEQVQQWVVKVHGWRAVEQTKPAAQSSYPPATAAAKPAAKPAAPVWGTSAAEEPSNEEVPF